MPSQGVAARAAIQSLRSAYDIEVRDDSVSRALYATDASIYELVPDAVVMPRTVGDLQAVMRVAAEHRVPVTARGAGTSLAGQAVGRGIIVDVGRHMTSIGALDVEARTIEVEPGVVRDDLNRFLAPHGLLFGPDTSTSNRCMIGGMIGNNSCGSNSILYGTTRENIEWLDCVLTDGSVERIGTVDRDGWDRWSARNDRWGEIVRTLGSMVAIHADAIERAFPRREVVRRNTGYALDDLAATWLGHTPDRDPNLARLLCGSEGTLALTGRAKLRLHALPKERVSVCAHFATLQEALHATVVAVRHAPAAVELMDRRILELSRLNAEQDRNRWFVEGDPSALLVIELYGETRDVLTERAHALVEDLRGATLGYAYPIIWPPQDLRVWELRKAGLGVLFGKPGDVKPVTLVEDTAVAVEDLPAYIHEFEGIMQAHGVDCVYYAHASVGELHLRPELNLKKEHDIARAGAIAREVADLVRSYRGSLSGEHGDGRLRGPFLDRVFTPEAMSWLSEVKRTFDPQGLLNPGSIVDTEPFEKNWRYHEDYQEVAFATEFRFAASGGMQRAVERCNGAGVCRRPAAAGGTMCPSFMVTMEERESTRGRANLFRLLLQEGPEALYGSDDLASALDLCISCKGCKRDCPASVDMAALKAEFQQGRIDHGHASWRARAFADATSLLGLAQRVPAGARVVNAVQSSAWFKALAHRTLGIAPSRTLPSLAPRSFWAQLRGRQIGSDGRHGTVCLFIDEFTNVFEPTLGFAALELLQAGGYRVVLPRVLPSGRAQLSKGYVRKARKLVEENIKILGDMLDRESVDAIVGIEPSSLLTLVDEALDLSLTEDLVATANAVAAKVLMADAFVYRAVAKGAWDATWTEASATVVLHGHCHQKALQGVHETLEALAIPPNYTSSIISSTCCGMAGSFGYESEHVEISRAIGELSLFPTVRALDGSTILCASGTSCRHQIEDGTGRVAQHPVLVLRDALATHETAILPGHA